MAEAKPNLYFVQVGLALGFFSRAVNIGKNWRVEVWLLLRGCNEGRGGRIVRLGLASRPELPTVYMGSSAFTDNCVDP